ncbi:MAG: tetratricopeptide repeat protein [Endomicrobiia bacterium]
MKIIKLIVLFIFLSSNLFCSFRKDINQGNRFFYKQQYEQAQQQYDSAEIKKPNSPIVYYNRANNFYKQQLYDQAIKEYQKSLGITKDKNLKSKILYNMGNAYLKLGDTKKAKESYIQALLNNPYDEDTKYNLQYALLELQNKPQNNKNQQQKQNIQHQDKNQSDKQQNQPQKYMSEQDIQRLIESVKQQQKDKLKEALKPQRPKLPEVEKDW